MSQTNRTGKRWTMNTGYGLYRAIRSRKTFKEKIDSLLHAWGGEDPVEEQDAKINTKPDRFD